MRAPDDLVPPLAAAPDLVWRARRGARASGTRTASSRVDARTARRELDPFPHGQPFAFEAQRPALAARGLAEAENELAALVRAGHRVVVAFPHRGEALRTQSLLRRVEAELLEPGDELPHDAELLFAVSPARRGFVWRELGLVAPARHAGLPQARAARATRGSAAALQSFADLRTGDYVVHEDHGVGQLLGFETKEVAGVTRDYLLLAFRGDDRLYVPHEQIGKVSRYIGADATRARALEARRQGLAAAQDPRARGGARARRRAARALRAAPERAGRRLRRSTTTGSSGSRPSSRTARRRTRQRAIEAVKEDLEAPRPMDRLVCGDVGFGKTEVAVRAAFAVAVNGRQMLMLVADDDPRRSSTGTPSASATATSRCASRWSRASARPAEVEARPRATSPRARSTS